MNEVIDKHKPFVCLVTDKLITYSGCREVRPPRCERYEQCGIKPLREVRASLRNEKQDKKEQ